MVVSLVLLPVLALLVPASALSIKRGVPAAPQPAAGLSNAARLAQGMPLKKPGSLFDASIPRKVARQATTSNLPVGARSVCEAYDSSQFGLSCTASGSASGPGGTCCNDSPGGLLLQTQFWDTGSTSTGPDNAWTLHGLWPDNCDSTYEQNCDASREESNIRSVLLAAGQQSLVSYMDTYWKDYQGNDESFWSHEWGKHGTCISSIEPACFVNYQDKSDLVTYFQRAVSTYQTLPSYDWLAADGIVPSLNVTYPISAIQNSLTSHYGFTPVIKCSDGAIDEIWYFYNSRGGILSGDLEKTAAVGSLTDCPVNVRYLPKYVTVTPPPTTAPGVNGAPPTAAGVKGFVYPIYADGSMETNTCLISGGTWYKGGTCAGYTAYTPAIAAPEGSYQLKTSKGFCGVSSSNQLSCSGTYTNATAPAFTFTASGQMAVSGTQTWGAASVPSGSVQVPVFLGDSQSVDFSLVFVQQ